MCIRISTFSWKACLATPPKLTFSPPQHQTWALGKISTKRYIPTRLFSLESTHTDIQAYPASFYPPKLLSHGFSDESGTPLPVTDVSVANLPLVNPSNSAPPSSVHLLPAMGISNGYFSTHSFTRVNTISNFPAAPILPGTSHLLPGVECREKRKPQNRPYQYQEPKKKGEVEPLHYSNIDG